MMNTHKMRLSAGLLAGLAVAGLWSARAAELSFTRTEDFTPVTLGMRPRQTDRTLLYAEFQVKYGLFHQYLHKWIDRPLFWNRALRPATFQYETAPSLARHAREMQKAGLDGLNMFALKGRTSEISKFKTWLGEQGLPEFSILPTLGYGDDGRKTADPTVFIEALTIAKNDPTFPRINGKLLVPTYNYRMFKPDEHRVLLAKLDAALGKGTYALCGDVDPGVIYNLRLAFARNGRLTDEENARLDRAVMDVLDVVDGVQMMVAEMKRPTDGAYCSLYDFTFFNACLAPAIERIYARPEYRSKILGYYVMQGYVNHMSGNDNSEEGTGTLRKYLRSVARTNPDYLLFFEWNEVNENTMFQPTVWGGRTAARILKYHSRLFKGLPPEPYAGDDTTVPPLALTYPAVAKYGEELHFEILNIPDGAYAEKMNVRLTLSDPQGKRLAEFPLETIDAARFGAIDYLVRTLDLQGTPDLVPTLTVNGRVYGGFAPVRLDPTVSWNYKAVRQCLRDGLQPAKAEVAVTRRADGGYDYSMSGDFPEDLASVELVCNEDELDACGLAGEYDREKNHLVQVLVSTPRPGAGSGCLAVEIAGATGCRVSPHYMANINSGVPVVRPDGSGFKVDALFWTERVGYVLQIPKTFDTKRVTVRVSRADKPAFAVASFPLADLLAKGALGAVLDTNTSFRVDMTRVDNLPDLPPHLATRQVNWAGVSTTRTPVPVFHFRAISESGRIWRSRPIRPSAPKGPRVTIPVFDEYAKKTGEAAIPAEWVPEIEYAFDPSNEAALVNAWDPFYNAHLGAGTWYCEPYSDPRVTCAPGCRSPRWVTDEGRAALAFDGVNDYINLPKEAFPQAAFTLEMEIKPDLPTNDVPMVLFRHFEFTRGSISVFIDRGQLVLTWGDRDLNREPRIYTGLPIRRGEWSHIAISYDFKEFRIVVNGQPFAYTWVGRPFRFKPSVFGGHDKVELSPRPPVAPVYYRGLLRRLAIRHRPIQ